MGDLFGVSQSTIRGRLVLVDRADVPTGDRAGTRRQ
jgi:hypothetical protein